MSSSREQEGQGTRRAWRWILAILVLVVLGGVFAAFSRPKGPSVQTSSVRGWFGSKPGAGSSSVYAPVERIIAWL